MAALTYRTAGKIEIEESLEQMSAIAAEDITAGISCRFDETTGKAEIASAASSGTADAYGIALKTVKAGSALTLLRRGVVDGFVLDSLEFGDPVYMANTTGAAADTAGSVTVKIGTVIPAHANLVGGAVHKLLRVDYADGIQTGS